MSDMPLIATDLFRRREMTRRAINERNTDTQSAAGAYSPAEMVTCPVVKIPIAFPAAGDRSMSLSSYPTGRDHLSGRPRIRCDTHERACRTETCDGLLSWRRNSDVRHWRSDYHIDHLCHHRCLPFPHAQHCSQRQTVPPQDRQPNTRYASRYFPIQVMPHLIVR